MNDPTSSASLTDMLLVWRTRRKLQRRLSQKVLNHTPSIKRRKCGLQKIKYTTENGDTETCSPKKTFWYMYYLNSPNRGGKYFEKKFRNWFTLPYDSFLERFHMVNQSDYFYRWNRRTNGVNSRLGLLLLDMLRYLGRVWNFNDLEESTVISVCVNRDFSHTI